MTQAFTPELCAHLSSLAPGFEGHWYYIEEDVYVGDGKYGKKVRIVCLGKDEELKLHQQVICPVWQVEDVLREAKNIKALESVCIECERKGVANSEDNCDHCGMNYSGIFISNVYYLIYKISEEMASNPDTAYQKIEECLWGILK